MTLLTSSVALAGTIDLFWLFFSRSDRVIAHPTDPAGFTTNLLLFGGPAVYIATQTWHGVTLFDDLRWSRAVAPLALFAGCLVTPAVPAYLSAITAAAIVIALVAFAHLRPHTFPLQHIRSTP